MIECFWNWRQNQEYAGGLMALLPVHVKVFLSIHFVYCGFQGLRLPLYTNGCSRSSALANIAFYDVASWALIILMDNNEGMIEIIILLSIEHYYKYPYYIPMYVYSIRWQYAYSIVASLKLIQYLIDRKSFHHSCTNCCSNGTRHTKNDLFDSATSYTIFIKSMYLYYVWFVLNSFSF